MQEEILQQFDKAVTDSKQLATKPSNEILLELYAFYKQATEGDAPDKGEYGMFDFVGKAKHEAWSKRKGMEKEVAMQEYIRLVNSLK